MRITKANDFSELHSVLCSKFRGNYQWVFRGQADIGWPLLPKAGRPDFCDYKDLEMFKGWRRRARACSELPDNEWDCLAVAQHHGLATRLLDWTFNPLVATYFAVAGSVKKDGVVYCFRHRSGNEINPD